MSAPESTFWEKHRGLVWSNPAADDSVHIRAALVRPRFSLLLEIVLEFGVERLRHEWAELQADDSRDVARARSSVERILAHIEQGFSLLPPATEKVWNFLKDQPALAGFVLPILSKMGSAGRSKVRRTVRSNANQPNANQQISVE